jgi:hypothetical protein
MLASAVNFAAGFWGIPYENKYLQSITIEAGGVSSSSVCVSELNWIFSSIIPLLLT